MKKSKSRLALLQLKASGKNKWIVCTLCPKDCGKPGGLISHLINDHLDGVALCIKCGRASENKHDQAVHAETHKKKDPLFHCTVCDIVYHAEDTYLQHVQDHKEGSDGELEPFLDNSEMRRRRKPLVRFESSNWTFLLLDRTLELFHFVSLFCFHLWSRCNTVDTDIMYNQVGSGFS